MATKTNGAAKGRTKRKERKNIVAGQAHIQAGGQLRQTGGPHALVFQHQIPCPGEDDTVKVDVRLTVVVRHALGQIIGRQMPDIVKQVARVLALLVKAVAIFILDNGPEDIRIGFIQSTALLRIGDSFAKIHAENYFQVSFRAQ